MKISNGLKWVCIKLIKVYQFCLKPLFPSSCRHTPSCSHYALEAIESHGPVQGMILAIKRIVKCHPWGSWGHDPVPLGNKKNEEQKTNKEQNTENRPKWC